MIRRLAGLALPLFALLACQAPPPAPAPVSRQVQVDQSTAAYCRQRAEEIYVAQNRADLYRSDNRDTPFSGSYLPNQTTRGLSDRYALDRMISDCVRNTGERSNPTQVPANAPPPPPLPRR